MYGRDVEWSWARVRNLISYLPDDKGESFPCLQFPSENKIRGKLPKQYSGQYDLFETDKNAHIFKRNFIQDRWV